MAKVTNRYGRPVSGQMPGAVEAIVIDNVDPEGLARVKVKFPTLPECPESYWARLSQPMAGQERGWVTIPEIGDEVLVVFMHGDINHALVVGGLHNGVDTPPYANEDGENNLRVFQSRSGHRVTFDDTSGAERIELVSHNKELHIVWDAANNIISVYSGGDIQIEAKEHLHIETNLFTLSAEEDISIQAGKDIIVDSGAVTGMLGGAQVQIQSPDVLIN